MTTLRQGPSGPVVDVETALPGSEIGDVLIRDAVEYVAINFDSAVIDMDLAQTPTVSDGHTFFVDASALTQNRNISPSSSGAGAQEAMTFIVTNPTSTVGGFSFSLVGANITKALTSKLTVEMVFQSSAWQITSWKPYTGTISP